MTSNDRLPTRPNGDVPRTLVRSRWRIPDAGLSLIETTLALGLALLVLGGLFELARPATTLNRALPAAADMHQRLRHAFDRLNSDLVDAGRGTTLVAAGPLGRFLPPVVPYVLGRRAAGVEHRHPDQSGVTLLSVSRGPAAETTILSPITGEVVSVQLRKDPVCTASACGYRRSDLVLVFDEGGRWDLFRVTSADPVTLTLERVHTTRTHFAPGAVIAPVTVVYYYYDDDRAQLRRYNGWAGDLPLVDDLVDLQFSYLGSSPSESPICDSVRGATGPLVAIDLAEFGDGPWCGPVDLPFDRDLLRIRAVEVSVRVQSGLEELRGADPRLFARPGSALGGRGAVPDYAVTFTVAPRNLNWW